MSTRRLARLGPGDRVRAGGVIRTVVGLSGTLVLLTDEAGQTAGIRLAHLLSEADFEVIGQRSTAPPSGSAAVLERLPDEVAERALWWERHILEVIHGLASDAAPGAGPRPGYDPAATTITGREKVKAAELQAAGHMATVSLVKRQRQRYESGGVAGLADQRLLRQPSRFGRVDARVVEAMQAAIAEATDDSTRTGGYVLWRTRQILDDPFAPPGWPPSPTAPSRP